MEHNELKNTNQSVNNFYLKKLEMTAKATRIIAASIIASRDFPKPSTLPRFSPLPFNNFGHFFLFDNSLFLKIIYQTVEKMKNVPKLRKYNFQPWLLAIASFIISTCLFFLSIEHDYSTHYDSMPLYYYMPVIISVMVYFISKYLIDEKVNKIIADYKAEVIQNLVEDEWMEDENVIYPNRLMNSFSAATNSIVPVQNKAILIRFDNVNTMQQFPGFGILQLEDKFVCPPKDLDLAIKVKENKLFESIVEKLKSKVQNGGINYINFQEVIVINSNSLSIDSPWLDERKEPILSKMIDIDEIYSFDKDASLRVYILVEVLFPMFESAACFFVRPFKVENSAGWQIAISTLGPPENGEEFINKKLMKYKIEKKGFSNDTIFETAAKNTNESYLHKIKENPTLELSFHEKISLSSLRDIDLLEEKNLNTTNFNIKTKKIIDNEISWPGKYYFYQYNIRERKSLTLGGDSFGFPELLSSISTIYDQISQTILESIEELGFDISKYKDKEGKFTINAENINKIIVGEVINVKPDEKKSTSKTENNNKTTE